MRGGMLSGCGADTRFRVEDVMGEGRHECRHGCRHVVDGVAGLVGGEVETDIDIGAVGTT